jgi:CheY-like chemotaxis protein
VTLNKDNITQAVDVVPGDYVMLSVTDTGSGMPPETVAKVFEPFFTTKEVGKGTGLGLAMVYGFVKQSNGHITVHSEVGRGTTFRLYLPRSEGVEEEVAVQLVAELPRGSERILVVEDEPQVRASVVRQLQSLGYTVSEAAHGKAAIAAFEAARLPYDLLLTDVVMPGPLGGRELADAVARRWPATKIVFVSGYAENAVLHEGQADEGVILLSKPFRKGDLARTVRQALDAAIDPARPLPKAA